MEMVFVNLKIMMMKKIDEIVYLEMDLHQTKAHYLTGEELLIDNNLERIAAKLPKEKFFKINDSSIINADFLKKIKCCTPKKVLLQKGLEVDISQSKYLELIEFLRMRYVIN